MIYYKNITQSIKDYIKANQIISQHNLWPYVIIPGILSFLYIFIIIVIGGIYFTDISNYINQNWIPSFMQGTIMTFISNILLWIILIFTGYISCQYIVMLLFSPILACLSEKVDNILYGSSTAKINIKIFLQDFIKGLLITIRNLVLSFFYTILAFILVLIPIIGPIAFTIIIFFIQSYYTGFGLAYYTLERKQFSFKESIDFSKKNKGMITFTGVGFMILMFIPLIGWFIAPSYGTVAATIATLNKINQ